MSGRVVRFEGVSHPAGDAYDLAIDRVSFALAPGQLASVEVPVLQSRNALADLACGLFAPEEGSIFVNDRCWTDRGPDDAAAMRGRIGRVFERGDWLQNLDVDENITLPIRYHHGIDPEQALAKAETLAQSLGQAELFRARPARVSRPELQRSQWVRALLGEPELLLIEHPAREVPHTWLPPFAQAVQAALQRGAAALWISSDPEETRRLGLTASLHLNGVGGTIRRI